MVVELDIFSDRPNPRWELDARSTQMLGHLQSTLSPSDRTAVEPPGLGYRGFKYANATGEWRAYKGFVANARAVFVDPSFEIELFLLSRLPSNYLTLRQKIASELRLP